MSLIAVVGDDKNGDALRDKLLAIMPHTDGLVTSSTRPTTIKSRFIANSQQLLRTDQEESRAVKNTTEEELKQAIDTLLPSHNVVILSDYGKGVLTDSIIEHVMALAAQHDIPVIVDPKGNDYSRYRGAHIVTPNRNELSQASNMIVKSDDEVRAAGMKVISTCGIQNVFATRSEDGISVISEHAEPIHMPTQAIEVYDVSGAGDTVISTVAAAIGCGASLEETASIANVAGGIVVGKMGTAVAYAHEVKLRIEKGEAAADTAGPIAPSLGLRDAVEQVERWRAQGHKVGFTNGCFDLLHPGHISLLEQSRSRCDKLIIGLNTDRSVQRLKGPSRPVQNETSRATVLGANAMVDMVILFDEETPINLIEAISPDLLVKGADYTIETVVGAEHVMSYGGEVYLAELQNGHSTTGTVARIAEGADTDKKEVA